ncbi:MAG: starch-binding protein [Ruminococcus sp.]|nr:starch-binding protein [Ruminococcus sp.]
MGKRITSVLLVLCMMISFVAVAGFAVSAQETDIAEVSAQEELASSGTDYGLAKKVEDGNILHCFNWTLSQIKEELPNIAQAGFTSVQTSPLQPHDGQYNWYWLYQPSDSTVGNELGSYNDLKNLCTEADKYGIKIVVDVVANHLAGSNDGSWAGAIAQSWRNGDYFHNEGACNNWDNRYDVTHKNIGMPDLNSEHSEVQSRFVSMVKSMKDAGVDGVRWDAAKHIGLPSEGCQFWSKISAVGMYNYGEILDNPAGSSGDDYNNSLMKEYANYIGVTDSSYSGHITGCIRDNKTDTWTGKWTNAGVPASRVVYWAESHDTFCNNGWTNSLGESVIDRSYAVVGARANSQSLYFSRPYDHNHDSIGYGKKGSTHYTSKEVAAVNHFHNAMAGTGEYFGADNGCFVVCRGGGAVIVSPNGSNFDITVKNGGGMVPAGTYTDEVSGSTWTVTGSSISGHIGSSGIAVIYDQPQAGPSAFANPGNTSYKTDTITVTLGYSNATSGSYSIDGGSFKSYTNGQTITIGSGVSYGSTTKLTVKATNGSSTDQATYTYTKLDPNATQTIYFNNSYYNWSRVYCYLYTENYGNVVSNNEWPGVEMTKGTNNIYYYDVPKGLENGRAIFTEYSDNNDHRYPGDGDPGLDLNNNSMIFGDNRSWTVYTGGPVTPQPTTAPTTAPTNPPVQPTQPVTGDLLIGDPDLDGIVSIIDATAIQKYLANLKVLFGRGLRAADCDQDGVVSVIDATKVQRYLANVKDNNSYVGQYTGGTAPATEPTTVQPTNPPISGDKVILNASATSTLPEKWYAWTWSSDSDGKWIAGDGEVSSVIFTGLSANVIFVRANPDMDIDWNNGSVWNQTDDLTTQMGGTFTTNSWAANRMVGSWS